MNIAYYELDSYNNGVLLPFIIELDGLSSQEELLKRISEELAKIKEKRPQWNCEEWILCDYEGVPSSFMGTYDLNPEFWVYKETMATTGYEWEIIEAAIECDIPLDEIEECYQGEYDSDEDFAYKMADDLGLIDKDAKWPNNCIDWEFAARELMYDYVCSNGHYFRSQ